MKFVLPAVPPGSRGEAKGPCCFMYTAPSAPALRKLPASPGARLPRRLTASARPMTGCDLPQIARSRPASRYGDRQHHAESRGRSGRPLAEPPICTPRYRGDGEAPCDTDLGHLHASADLQRRSMNRGSHPVLGGALAAVAAAIARALSLPSCGAWLTAQPGAAAPGLRRRRASWPSGAPASFTSCRDMAARAGDPLTAC